MAVMDQDNFSNISWHSEQESSTVVPSAAASAHESAASEYPGSSRQDGARTVEGEDANLEPAHGGEILECVVSDPRKENDGTKDAYVSYMITTHVGLCSWDITCRNVR
jgi:sorting nexin-4